MENLDKLFSMEGRFNLNVFLEMSQNKDLNLCMIRKCGYDGKDCSNDEKVFEKLQVCLNHVKLAEDMGINDPRIKCGTICERKNKQTPTLQRMIMYNDVEHQYKVINFSNIPKTQDKLQQVKKCLFLYKEKILKIQKFDQWNRTHDQKLSYQQVKDVYDEGLDLCFKQFFDNKPKEIVTTFKCNFKCSEFDQVVSKEIYDRFKLKPFEDNIDEISKNLSDFLLKKNKQ